MAPVQDVAPTTQFLQQYGLTQTDGEVAILAESLRPDFVLVDDREVRRAVQSMGMKVLGTAALTLTFKQAGLIPSCREVLDLMQKSGFGVDPLIYAQVVGLAGE